MTQETFIAGGLIASSLLTFLAWLMVKLFKIVRRSIRKGKGLHVEYNVYDERLVRLRDANSDDFYE